jgi:hypothetical protein
MNYFAEEVRPGGRAVLCLIKVAVQDERLSLR